MRLAHVKIGSVQTAWFRQPSPLLSDCRFGHLGEGGQPTNCPKSLAKKSNGQSLPGRQSITTLLISRLGACAWAAPSGDRSGGPDRGRRLPIAATPTKDGNSMRRTASALHLLLVGMLIGLAGCHPTQPFYLHGDGDLSHYIDKATEVDTPDVHQAPLPEVEHALEPLTLSHPEFKEFWELSLEECVAITLANSKVLRGGNSARLQNGQLFPGVQQGSRLTNIGNLLATTYDPAIVESNPGQSNGAVPGFLQSGAGNAFNGPSVDGGPANVRQGVEAALAEFDAQLNISGTGPSSSLLSSTDRPQNVTPAFVGFPTTLNLRQGGINATLAKRTAEGTLVSVTSTTDNNQGNQRGS